jgi:hypothetical protein
MRKPRLTADTVILGLVLVVIVWVAIRHFLRLRELGDVDSAIGTMGTLVNDENKYAQAHPSVGYTCRLTEVTGNPIMASANRSGYIFAIDNCMTKAGSGPNTSYTLTARPLHSQTPAFCADESGIVKADYDGSIAHCLQNGQPL